MEPDELALRQCVMLKSNGKARVFTYITFALARDESI